MRHDTIEIGLATKATLRRARSRKLRKRVLAQCAADAGAGALAAEVVDEAFAGLSNDASPAEPAHRSLLVQLSAQLKALDEQRDHLAQLLRDVETTALGE
jgi:hypothetical protein